MNLIMTPARASLDGKTTPPPAPPVSSFCPASYVTSGLTEGHHSVDSRECMKNGKKCINQSINESGIFKVV